MFSSGRSGLYDQNLEALSREPPCMQWSKIVLWPFGKSFNNRSIQLVFQNKEFAGFSMETEISQPINISKSSAMALYEAFALSTLWRPSGKSSLRKGWGCCAWVLLPLSCLALVKLCHNLGRNAHVQCSLFQPSKLPQGLHIAADLTSRNLPPHNFLLSWVSLSIGRARKPNLRQALHPEKNSTTKPTSLCCLLSTEFPKGSEGRPSSLHALSKFAPDLIAGSPSRDAPEVSWTSCHEPAFEWQAAAPCFGLRQRMHVWYPNLHRPFFVWLLHPLLKL